ncbi:MAG: LemA family protein [Microvirga sp.]
MEWVLLAIVVAVVLYGVVTYNGLVSLRQRVTQAFADIDVQLKQRHDLIPNLVETVKGYASHERETLEGVIAARAKATSVQVNADQLTPENLKKFEDAQSQLRGALSRLMVVAEQYPQLKANENFRSLQDQLEGTENRIAVSRRRYIDAVQQFNNLVTVPPTSWTNGMFYKKQPKPQFAATTPNAEQAPKVKF